MKQLIRMVALFLVAGGLMFSSAACGGGKADEAACKKAGEQLAKITLAQAKLPDNAPDAAKKAAKDAADQTVTAFVKGCTGNYPSGAIECFGKAEDMAAWQKCATDAAGG